MKRRLAPFAAVLAALTLLAGCSSSHRTTTRHRTLTVFAAASLMKAFTAEGQAFETLHPGIAFEFSFAGSQTLVAQVRQGAPASVLATADLATIDAVKDRLVAPAEVFAHNQLAIVTAPGNPLHLTSLPDLAKGHVKVVLAGPTVPVGKASAKALKAAGVHLTPLSLEDSVSGVVTKVRLGEADAGIAYVTDLRGARLGGVPLAHTRTALAIGALAGAAHLADAQDFVAFVRSEAGQKILMSFGFQ